jgi:pimeloyl-ACP methyl ester carboxylesterase
VSVYWKVALPLMTSPFEVEQRRVEPCAYLPQACHALAQPDTRAVLTYRGLMKARRVQHSSPIYKVAALGAVLALLAVGGLVGAPASLAAANPLTATNLPLVRATETLTWRSCGARLECSSLIVPKDYANPALGTITLALNKVPARGQKMGTLVVNPGGPGVAGLGYAAYLASALPASVNAMYDIVGFDTRGAGASARVICLTGRQTTRWLRADPTPDTRPEQRAYLKLASEISAGCLERSPQIAPYVSSDATVQDLDSIRVALGEDRLNWLGFSYGTYLGALYAEKFPHRVGKMVLDGAVDPALDAMQISQGQSEGFQRSLLSFSRDCITHANCPSTKSSRQVLAGINRLLTRLDSAPMETRGPLPLNEAQAMTALFSAMYTPDRWQTLRQALSAAKQGDGTPLQSMAESASDQTGPNSYATNMASAFYAISCLDVPATPRLKGLRDFASEWARNAPVPAIARAMSWGNAPCSYWFSHGAPRSPVQSTTTAPILIVGTTGDPATPYSWAQELNRQLTTSSLLTFRGQGHTATANGSNCIDSSVADYLTTGAMPPPGKTCS